MAKKPKSRRSLEEILASCSETLFPQEMGRATATLQSRSIEGDTALHVMLWRGDTYAVKALIEAGADVNAIGDMGETPLHVAIRKENTLAVEALIMRGADATVTSEFGQTPADLATESSEQIKTAFKTIR